MNHCETCRHWRADPATKNFWGECRYLLSHQSPLLIDADERIRNPVVLTMGTFGCVEHKAKETDTDG